MLELQLLANRGRGSAYIDVAEELSVMSEKVAIIGSGLMGMGIAQSFATAGHQVKLVDVSEDALSRARSGIRESLQYLWKQGLLDERPATVLARIHISTDRRKAVSDATFVVEAVFENVEVKKKVFREIDVESSPSAILASNTSSIPITLIASATNHPERVVGTHFWNPPNLMLAVEVVKGEKTSEETVKRTVEVLREIGKKPAVVRKDVPGQIGIRILYAMIREATWLVENGIASAEDVDTIVKEALGMRLEVLGPLELADLSGIDLVDNVAKGLYKSLDASQEPQKLIEDMVARGDVGIKSGRGFYDWKDGSRDPAATLRIRDRHLVKMQKERKKAKT
jgi:3-hydroxybutyryl-CoA dehydrogenase